MNAADLIEILKYVSKFEHPIFIGSITGIIVYWLLKIFKISEYVTAGKQGYEELERRYKILSDALDESERRCSEFERRCENLEKENHELRGGIPVK